MYSKFALVAATAMFLAISVIFLPFLILKCDKFVWKWHSVENAYLDDFGCGASILGVQN